MKDKSSVLVGMVFILAALLGSWALSLGASASEEAQSESAVVLTHDKTAMPQFVYNPDSISEDSVAGEKRYGAAQSGAADPVVAAVGSTVVVRGRISGVYYTFIGGTAWTQADLRVTESLKGTLAAGDIISVYFPGGYASTADYAGYYGAQDGETGSDASFYRFSVDLLAPPAQGDEDLLFLIQRPGSAIPEGAYSLSRGAYSVYSFSADAQSLEGAGGQYSYSELRQLIRRGA